MLGEHAGATHGDANTTGGHATRRLAAATRPFTDRIRPRLCPALRRVGGRRSALRRAGRVVALPPHPRRRGRTPDRRTLRLRTRPHRLRPRPPYLRLDQRRGATRPRAARPLHPRLRLQCGQAGALRRLPLCPQRHPGGDHRTDAGRQLPAPALPPARPRHPARPRSVHRRPAGARGQRPRLLALPRAGPAAPLERARGLAGRAPAGPLPDGALHRRGADAERPGDHVRAPLRRRAAAPLATGGCGRGLLARSRGGGRDPRPLPLHRPPLRRDRPARLRGARRAARALGAGARALARPGGGGGDHRGRRRAEPPLGARLRLAAADRPGEHPGPGRPGGSARGDHRAGECRRLRLAGHGPPFLQRRHLGRGARRDGRPGAAGRDVVGTRRAGRRPSSATSP